MIALFRRLFLASLLAGLVAGGIGWAARQVVAVPIILWAEAHEHADGAPGHAHAAEDAGWKPAEGWPRAAFTLLTDILAGIAFALLLGAAMFAAGGARGWRDGVGWGFAGFLVFSFAPALGLPPELPGVEAAALPARQAWWLLTVSLTALGLAVARFGAHPARYALAAALLAAPHIWGAPHAAGDGGHADMARAFVVLALLSNAIFWCALGAASFRFQPRPTPKS